jgi:hypothetical protein
VLVPVWYLQQKAAQNKAGLAGAIPLYLIDLVPALRLEPGHRDEAATEFKAAEK